MKTSLLGAMALLLSCGLASAQPALVPVKTEAQLIFDKCRAAYAGLKTYHGTVRTDSVSLFDGVAHDIVGSATVTFQNPGLLRIDGQMAGEGDAYSILRNNNGSWYRWALDGKNEWQQVKDLNAAVSTITSVSDGTPGTVSSLLVPSLVGAMFFKDEAAKFDGEELIDGQPCIRITATLPTETISWFIDKKTLLLRRFAETYTEAQSAAQRKLEGGAPTVQVRYIRRIVNFGIEATDGAVDEKLLETPMPK